MKISFHFRFIKQVMNNQYKTTITFNVWNYTCVCFRVFACCIYIRMYSGIYMHTIVDITNVCLYMYYFLVHNLCVFVYLYIFVWGVLTIVSDFSFLFYLKISKSAWSQTYVHMYVYICSHTNKCSHVFRTASLSFVCLTKNDSARKWV